MRRLAHGLVTAGALLALLSAAPAGAASGPRYGAFDNLAGVGDCQQDGESLSYFAVTWMKGS